MKYTVEFFKPAEFLCPCCKNGQVSAALVYSLDVLRRAWDMPILVNSAWRCYEHNIQVGGAKQSRHLIGCAADIKPLKPELIGPFQSLVGYLFGRREGWELKLYPTFVHIGVPRTEQSNLWTGGVITVNIK